LYSAVKSEDTEALDKIKGLKQCIYDTITVQQSTLWVIGAYNCAATIRWPSHFIFAKNKVLHRKRRTIRFSH